MSSYGLFNILFLAVITTSLAAFFTAAGMKCGRIFKMKFYKYLEKLSKF